MDEINFTDRVKKYFGYLQSEYGYKETLERNSQDRPGTDGIVKYASDTTLVLIDSVVGQATVRFARLHDDERYYIDPVSIHEYLNTSEKEKQILLSKDVKDKDTANFIFSKKFLLAAPEWKNSNEDVYIDLDRRLKNYAKWLKENSALCLLGDFSRWPEIYEYKIDRLIADELRRGGKNVVLAVVKDEDGSFNTIERPIFQREKNYLTKLRKEVFG